MNNDLRLLQLRRTALMMAPDAGGASGAAAESPAAQTGMDGAGQADDAAGAEKPEKAFTQADIDRIIRAEKAKWQRQQQKAVSEAERLAKLSTEERAAEEARVREEALNQREAEITRRELRAQALQDLAAQQMPSELAELLDYKDAQACSASIQKLKSVWQKAVQKGVEERVASGAPRSGAAGSTPKDMRSAIAAHYNRT